MDKMSEAYKGKEAEVYHKLISKIFNYEEVAENMNRILQTNVKTLNSNRKTKLFTLIELGVGTGKLAEQMVNLGHKVIGVDVSDDMMNIAKKEFEKKYENHPYFWKDFKIIKKAAENYRIKTENVDGVYSNGGPIAMMTSNFGLDVRVDSYETLIKIVKNTYNNLEEGGLFLINVETPRHFKTNPVNGEFAGIEIIDYGKYSRTYKRRHYHVAGKKGVDHELYLESPLLEEKDLKKVLKNEGFSKISDFENAEKTGWVWARK